MKISEHGFSTVATRSRGAIPGRTTRHFEVAVFETFELSSIENKQGLFALGTKRRTGTVSQNSTSIGLESAS